MGQHLRLDVIGAIFSEEYPDSHAQIIMKELGINYQHSTPQSISEEWLFWNCENVPKELPEFIKVADLNPMDWIGYGLSQEDAEKIRDYKK